MNWRPGAGGEGGRKELSDWAGGPIGLLDVALQKSAGGSPVI